MAVWRVAVMMRSLTGLQWSKHWEAAGDRAMPTPCCAGPAVTSNAQHMHLAASGLYRAA